MKLLVFVTPPSIYNCCSTQKTFWEEDFICKKDLFQSVNMKNCGRIKVRKQKEIKGSDKIVTLNISAKFDSLNNIKTTYLESKEKNGKIRKGVGYRSVFQDQGKVVKIQKGKLFHRKCQ